MGVLSPEHPLRRLAAAFGVQAGYRDSRGREQTAAEPALRAVLEALGADLSGPGGLTAALEARCRELEGRLIEPVLVAWEGRLPDLRLRLPVRRGHAGGGGVRAWGPAGGPATAAGAVRFFLACESGETLSWEVPAGRLVPVAVESGQGTAASVFRLPGDAIRGAPAIRAGRLPWGRHHLLAEWEGRSAESVIVSAPRRCWAPDAEGGRAPDAGAPDAGAAGAAGASVSRLDPSDPLAALAGRPWGVFCPVYALRSRRDWGAGDLADFASLGAWVSGRGGTAIATLPLLAPLWSAPSDPSPYRPSSRLFWNEFFLAVDRLPEWERCAAARVFWESAATQLEVARLRDLPRVDHEAVAALKRQALGLLAAHFGEQPGADEEAEFARFVREHPLAVEFATFQEGGRAAHYHLYCQWRMEGQLATLSESLPGGLVLDLPLGVHPQGFDARRWPELFVQRVSAGAPPDDFFTKGQVWDCPPLHPEADRADGYRYMSACLSQQMRFARYLRIDHMMGFHRLFWVPEGMEAVDGVYVSYHAEEAYAVLALESHRHRTMVVGEDLGTVPPGVRSSMSRHNVGRTWVFQSSLRRRGPAVAAPVPPGSLATLNTHDMVPLAGFLRGADISLRERLGLLERGAARREAAARRRLAARLAEAFGIPASAGTARKTRSILAGALAWLAASPARLVLVNLEDLWLETEPQNVPGTGPERPNWRGKTARALEELDPPRSSFCRRREAERGSSKRGSSAAGSARP
jgi:4-alpha-glucanotransferase